MIIIVAALLTTVCERTRFLQALEMANFDAWVISQDPSTSNDIVLVNIDEGDYQSPVFKKTSPLDACEVWKLIAKISEAGARAIVIDLDTSHWKRDDLPDDWSKTLPRHPLRTTKDIPVIWARTMSKQNGVIIPSHFAGRDDADVVDEKDLCWGIPEMVQSTGLVRSYRTRIPISAAGATVPSLATAAAIAFAKSSPPASRRIVTVPDSLRNCEAVSGGFENAPNEAILKAGRVRFAEFRSADLRTYKDFPPLRDKLVVLGGTFLEARDSYGTPAGAVDGLNLLATAIDSELHKPMPMEPSGWEFFTVDILAGVLLLFASCVLPRALGLLFVLSGVPLAAIFCSFIVYQSGSYFFSFVPVLVGVFFHKIFDQWWEAIASGKKHRADRKTIARLRKRNRNLNFQLSALDGTRKTLADRDSVEVLARITQERA